MESLRLESLIIITIVSILFFGVIVIIIIIIDLWTDPEITKKDKGDKDEKKRGKDSTEKRKEGQQ